MKKINIVFLVFALLTAFFMILIGIAIAERSILGSLGAIVGVIATTGVAFSYKAKLRKSSE
ncbi:DUF5325 family protein [Bacillus pinisoli]|uniref:DUF5325 family protein n=1 Tax=Bacillus pinisoli TaxID=2901866 RepID=UPI001FF39C35|nr:DUF5325 family protein [Bacillus pinisoli]